MQCCTWPVQRRRLGWTTIIISCPAKPKPPSGGAVDGSEAEQKTPGLTNSQSTSRCWRSRCWRLAPVLFKFSSSQSAPGGEAPPLSDPKPWSQQKNGQGARRAICDVASKYAGPLRVSRPAPGPAQPPTALAWLHPPATYLRLLVLSQRRKFVPCLTRPAPQVDAVREVVSRRGRHSRSPEAVDAAHCAAVPPPPPPAVEAALRARPQATATLRGSAGPAVV